MALNAKFSVICSPNSVTRESSASTSHCPLLHHPTLRNNGAGGGRLVLPGGGQDANGLVVAGKTVDTRLDENETELGVLVLAVALEVLADGDGLSILSALALVLAEGMSSV